MFGDNMFIIRLLAFFPCQLELKVHSFHDGSFVDWVVDAEFEDEACFLHPARLKHRAKQIKKAKSLIFIDRLLEMW